MSGMTVRRLGCFVAVAASLAAASGACGWVWAVYWQAWPWYVLGLVMLAVVAVRWMPVVLVSVVMPIAFTVGFALPFETDVLVSTGLWAIGASAGFAGMAIATPLIAVPADLLWRKRAACRERDRGRLH